MKIQKICIFAYATEGEALVTANNTVQDTMIAEVRIMKGLVPAREPVAFLVVPTHLYKAVADIKTGDLSNA